LRRRLAIPVLLALAALFGAALARGELAQEGNLRISFDGGFAPRSLPRDRPAPVTVNIEGSISTTDGSHPPALRRLEVALNRNGHLATRGLPACTSPLLQSTTTAIALARCRPALVGRGSFKAEVESTQTTIPASGTILAFNGRSRGKPALLLHLYAAVPVRVTFVLPLTISHLAKGRFGTVLSASVPVLAGGLGSVTDIKLKIGREYVVGGKRIGFISASCAAPAGFPGAVFTFARGSFYFADGRRLDTSLSRDCSVRQPRRP
jgi:hypothetical protein